MCELQNYIIPHIRAREAEPREDLMSDLVHARLEDDRNPALSFEEKLSCIRAFLIAGNDTTAAALANLMMILATQPALARQLSESADDERMVSRFVEEVLRLEPPSHGLYRTTMREVQLGGTVLPAYAQVCILFASANDDDSQFPQPRSLDDDSRSQRAPTEDRRSDCRGHFARGPRSGDHSAHFRRAGRAHQDHHVLLLKQTTCTLRSGTAPLEILRSPKPSAATGT
jgi:cytochrome P450